MKLNTKRTMLVGLAFLSICIFWQMYDSVMTLILTDTFHLNETIAGAVMAADNVLALFLCRSSALCRIRRIRALAAGCPTSLAAQRRRSY